jgi:prophage regulatory protein
MATTILRLKSVLHARGRSRSSHYSDIKAGVFTKPVHIGSRAVGWPANELEQINAARVAAKSDAEIRA